MRNTIQTIGSTGGTGLICVMCAMSFMGVFAVNATAQTQPAHGMHWFPTFGIGQRTPINLAIGQVGLGGEYISRPGIGLGGDVAYLSALRDFGSGVGVVSLNGSYHFASRGTIDPFIKGGYTGFVAFGSAHGMNFGGGLNRWLNDRIA